MNGFIRLIIVSAMIATLTSCASDTPRNGDDLIADEGGQSIDGDFTEASQDDEKKSSAQSEFEGDQSLDGESNESKDEFSEFDDKKGTETAKSAGEDSDLSLDEPNNTKQDIAGDQDSNSSDSQVANPPSDSEQELTLDENQEDPFQSATPSSNTVLESTPAPIEPTEKSAASSEIASSSQVKTQPAQIKDLKFKANETGGTVLVTADKPLSFTTRSNVENNQFIVEIENSVLPNKLKRSLNTRDIKGSIGAVDAYQNPGSTISRIVVQLREGQIEPAVQSEGNNLLIIAGGIAENSAVKAALSNNKSVSGTTADSSADIVGQDSKILPNQSLNEFLTNNTEFYGDKISMEFEDIPVQKVIADIVEQAGLNVVVSEKVNGKVSLKLRQVPWDQALIIIMRSQKLGYNRFGNLLRIAPLDEIKAEEEEANSMAQSRKTVETLKVRMFNISYAKVEDLEPKIAKFLSERGKAASDSRTNAIVVTDLSDNLDRIGKLIASLDVQPQQVLIEGKIVEAKEDFVRSVGISWGLSGAPVKLGNSPRGPVNMNPSLGINQGTALKSGNLSLGLNIGTLDVFGTISAALALSEQESKAKVLASPRIFTLSNEAASISQKTEVPVKKVTILNGVSEVTYQKEPLELHLDVTPQITADGSVIMKVGVKRQFQGAIIDQANGTFSVHTREASTKVLVKNGQTAVIGGIYQSDATDGEAGVPWLKNIPLFGWLFKSKDVTKSKSELLIFLTPRILGQVESSSSADL